MPLSLESAPVSAGGGPGPRHAQSARVPVPLPYPADSPAPARPPALSARAPRAAQSSQDRGPGFILRDAACAVNERGITPSSITRGVISPRPGWASRARGRSALRLAGPLYRQTRKAGRYFGVWLRHCNSGLRIPEWQWGPPDLLPDSSPASLHKLPQTQDATSSLNFTRV